MTATACTVNGCTTPATLTHEHYGDACADHARELDNYPHWWTKIIKDWQFDPDAMEIVDGSIELIGWDSPIKGTDQSQRLRRYKGAV